MGVKFYQHMGGRNIYSCKKCGINLTNSDTKISSRFQASTGAAFLFAKAVNITYGDAVEKMMLTGSYIVRDANCKKCEKTIGWVYEFAYSKDQKYKEGMIILEKAYISASPGIRES